MSRILKINQGEIAWSKIFRPKRRKKAKKGGIRQKWAEKRKKVKNAKR